MIKVNRVQEGNGLLKCLNRTSWVYNSEISCDYEINESVSVLFLSLKYHASKPEYIFKRIRKNKEYKVNVVLIQLDVPNFNFTLQELYRDIPYIMVLSRNNEESANYIRSLDLANVKSINTIRNKEAGVDNFLGEIPVTNITDVTIVKSSFKNLKELIDVDQNTLEKLPGFGKKKARSVLEYFYKDFK